MARYEVQGRVSYSALMGIYSGGDYELDLTAISEGKKLETTLIEMIRSGNIPLYLNGVVTERYRHNKTDVDRVLLNAGGENLFGVEFFIKPDFVFTNNSVVDVKLGRPQPPHVIQAIMVARVMQAKYKISPNYYLLTDNLSELYLVDLHDRETNEAFDKFVIGCVARAGLQVTGEGWGGMFGGAEDVAWNDLLGTDNDILNSIGQAFLGINLSFLGVPSK